MYDGKLTDIKQEIYGNYIESARDQRLHSMLRTMVANVEDCRKGVGSRQRALFIIGDSGSGKSFSLKYHFGRIPEFQPRANEFDEIVNPLLSIEAPKPCTTKDFAIAILEAMGLPTNDRLTESRLYSLVKTQLKTRGILYLHVDEAQHLIRHNKESAIHDVQDRLKSLIQIEDWPLHTIYSGVPDLAALLTSDPQLANRSHVLRYMPQKSDTDKYWIKDALRKIAQEISKLSVPDEVLSDDFISRLCHSAQGGLGKIIETIQAACILVMEKNKSALDVRAFAHVYQENSGCLPEHNIFRVQRWSEISPSHVLADLQTSAIRRSKR